MRHLLAIVLVGLGVYLSRALFILLLAKRRLPATWLVPLQFVAPAVLSALVVALTIDADGRVQVGIPEVVAFAVAGVTARRTRSHVLPLVLGLGAYWLGRALL